MSNFAFVNDLTLRTNLDIAFNHTVDLLAYSVSKNYKNEKILVSSLRKTMIIHTASIIEALLLWKLKEKCTTKKIELVDDWNYVEIKTLYQISKSEEVIGARRKKEMKDMNKLDFARIIKLCFEQGIVKNETLREDIDKVRLLRNRQHLGGLLEIEKEYTKEDLEFCFDVAKRVKSILK